MDLIPPYILVELAKVLTFGAKKYGANSWQQLEDFDARYTAAMMRHFEEWRSGQRIDPESGLPTLAHALCNISFLLWKELSGEQN